MPQLFFFRKFYQRYFCVGSTRDIIIIIIIIIINIIYMNVEEIYILPRFIKKLVYHEKYVHRIRVALGLYVEVPVVFVFCLTRVNSHF